MKIKKDEVQFGFMLGLKITHGVKSVLDHHDYSDTPSQREQFKHEIKRDR